MKRLLFISILLYFNCLVGFSQVPTHLWSNNIASSNDRSEVVATAVNQQGDVYVVGGINTSADFDPSSNIANISASTPLGELYIAKYDKDGNYVWAYPFGQGNASTIDIKLDTQGYIYIVGRFFDSVDFDIYPNSVYTLNSNTPATFLVKYDVDGRLVWADKIENLSSTGGNFITDFTLDENNKIIVAGIFGETISFGSSNFQMTTNIANATNGFFAKYDNNGNFVWAKQIETTTTAGINYPSEVATDLSLSLYIIFDYRIPTDFDPSVNSFILTPTIPFTPNYAIIKYDFNGNFVWAKPIDVISLGNGMNFTIHITPNNEINFIGSLQGVFDFDPSAATSIHSSPTDLNTFFAKYDTNGNLLDRKQITGLRNSIGKSTTDAAGNLYFPFSYQGTVDIDLSPTGTVNLTAVSPPFPNYSDLSMVSFDKDFNYLWHGQVFPQNDNVSYVSGSDLELDTKGNFYMAGNVRGTADFDMLSGVANVSSLGTIEPNSFLAKYGIPECSLNLKSDTVVCGSSLMLTAPSGFTSYTWTYPDGITTSTNPTISANQVGVYLLEIVSRCGTAKDSIDVSFTPSATLDLGTDKQICVGSSTVLNAPSGFTSYTWTLPNSTTSNVQNLTATEAGTYSLSVSSSCGIITDNIDVVISPFPTVDLGIDKQICAGTSTVLNAPSGFTSYTWTLPNNSVSNLQTITVSEAGIYKLSVTNSCGAATDEIKVQISPNPSLNLGNDVFTCQSDTTLSAPLGFGSYLWTFPNGTTATNPTITVSQAGNYILKVENNCGIAFDTVAINFNQKPNIDLGIDTLLCQNESLTISLPNDYAYLWFDADTSKTRSFSNAGIYYFDILNECGSKRDSIIINNFVEPTVNLGEDRLLCEGETVILSINNPTNFPVLWNTGETTNSIEITQKGTYKVEVFSNCEVYADSIEINYKSKPNLTPINDTILCNNENYFVEIDSTNQDVSIIWFDGNTDFSRILNGSFQYSYTLSNECGSVSDTFSIVLPDNEEINIDLGEDKILCNSESTLLSAVNESDNFNYLWSTGSTEPQITVNTAGTYIVTVSKLCTSKSDTIKIDYLEEINTEIQLTQKNCGEAILNVDLKENETIKWNDGSRESEFIPLESGTYEAEVSNTCETKKYSIEVEIIDFTQAFPNVITPNDDGLNDAYVLPFEGAQIFVYDRWEKLVYRNDNYKNDWSPKNLTGGTYYLLIKHPCLDGNKKIVFSILK